MNDWLDLIKGEFADGGEVSYVGAGRCVGKSLFGSNLCQEYEAVFDNKTYRVLDRELVDGNPWYTLDIASQDIWRWLNEQAGSWSSYYSPVHRASLVDMEEKLYVALVLRWGK